MAVYAACALADLLSNYYDDRWWQKEISMSDHTDLWDFSFLFYIFVLYNLALYHCCFEIIQFEIAYCALKRFIEKKAKKVWM